MCVPTKYVSHSEGFLPRKERCLSSAWVKRGKVDPNVSSMLINAAAEGVYTFCMLMLHLGVESVDFRDAHYGGWVGGVAA